MWQRIVHELKEHLPFTVFGAATGIILMIALKGLPHETSHTMFYALHPMHVVLSALVTASMYELHRCGKLRRKCNLFILLAVGYFGSVGIATVSDSLIPYWGEALFHMPYRQVHIGFIEKWWLVNPLALVGIAIAYFRPSTKFPHAAHVLLSTWASLFHILMAAGETISWVSYAGLFVFLFLAVWLPCCVSDIVFPMLFVKKRENLSH